MPRREVKSLLPSELHEKFPILALASMQLCPLCACLPSQQQCVALPYGEGMAAHVCVCLGPGEN